MPEKFSCCCGSFRCWRSAWVIREVLNFGSSTGEERVIKFAGWTTRLSLQGMHVVVSWWTPWVTQTFFTKLLFSFNFRHFSGRTCTRPLNHMVTKSRLTSTPVRVGHGWFADDRGGCRQNCTHIRRHHPWGWGSRWTHGGWGHSQWGWRVHHASWSPRHHQIWWEPWWGPWRRIWRHPWWRPWGPAWWRTWWERPRRIAKGWRVDWKIRLDWWWPYGRWPRWGARRCRWHGLSLWSILSAFYFVIVTLSTLVNEWWAQWWMRQLSFSYSTPSKSAFSQHFQEKCASDVL